MINFFKRINLLYLVFVEARIVVGSSDSRLFVVLDLMVVVFDDLMFVPVVVVEVPDSMAKRTIFSLLEAESSEVEPAE